MARRSYGFHPLSPISTDTAFLRCMSSLQVYGFTRASALTILEQFSNHIQNALIVEGNRSFFIPGAFLSRIREERDGAVKKEHAVLPDSPIPDYTALNHAGVIHAGVIAAIVIVSLLLLAMTLSH